MKKNNGRGTRFQCRRTVHLTATEDERLRVQDDSAGLSVSEYMRRLFFGSRPIIARTDVQTIRELRRLGACSSIILRTSGQWAERKALKKWTGHFSQSGGPSKH